MKVPTQNNFQATPNVLPAARSDLGITAEQASVGSRQMQALGQGIQNAGGVAGQIALDMQQETNKLRYQDATNKAVMAAQRLTLDPNEGFSNLKGNAALERPDGKSLVGEYTEKLDKEFEGISGSLSNPAQQQAFQQWAADYRGKFTGDLMRHQTQEFNSWADSTDDATYETRAEQLASNYDKPDLVAGSIQGMSQALANKARRAGKSESWAMVSIQEGLSKAHKTAVSVALQKNDVVGAENHLKQYASQMKADDILKVRGEVDTAKNKILVNDSVTGLLSENLPKIIPQEGERAFNILLGTESGNRQFAEDGTPLTSPKGAIGIAQVMPDTAPEAAELAGVPFDEEKYRNDPVYNAKLGRAYFEKQLRVFGGDLSLAYAAYNAGAGKETATGFDSAGKPLKGVKPAMARAAAKGTPERWLEELPAETQNYVQKNMREYQAGGGKPERPTETELKQRLREDPRFTNNPEALAQAETLLEKRYGEIDKALKDKDTRLKDTLMQRMSSLNGDWTQLTTAEQSAAQKAGIWDEVTKYKGVTDPTAEAQLRSLPPEELAKADLRDYALRLSASDREEWAKKQSELVKSKAAVFQETQKQQLVQNYFRQMGKNPDAAKTTPDGIKFASFQREFDNAIVDFEARTGKKPSPEDQRKLLSALSFDSGGGSVFDKLRSSRADTDRNSVATVDDWTQAWQSLRVNNDVPLATFIENPGDVLQPLAPEYEPEQITAVVERLFFHGEQITPELLRAALKTRYAGIQ
jgi:soluble lytic murein transglycosylase